MTVTDPLTDPALAEPRRESKHDPMAGHRAFMKRIGQAEWLEGALHRAFGRPIEEVEADLEARREAEKPKPAAKKAAPARKPQPPKQRPGS